MCIKPFFLPSYNKIPHGRCIHNGLAQVKQISMIHTRTVEWDKYLWIRFLYSKRAGLPKAGWQVGALNMCRADTCPYAYWGFYIKKRITLWNRPSARVYITSLPFTQVYSKHTHNNKQQTKLEEVQSQRVSVCGGQAGTVPDSGEPKCRRQGVCDPAVEAEACVYYFLQYVTCQTNEGLWEHRKGSR